MTTNIVLENPKYPHNVGQAVRAAALFDVTAIVTSGDRVPLKPNSNYRLPREERYWKYANVKVENHKHPIDRARMHASTLRPAVVGVELHHGATPLPYFMHPEDVIYVFGPEDGSISLKLRRECHQLVFIPTPTCLNLAAAINVVLYDRLLKEVQSGTRQMASLEELMARD
jgi:tRNA(Leu) C34 or U34 (ribose-2'-O)-methylase TrmL